ncbi:MAG: endolytic transglycosylase MltG [Elusimicrobia bacterium]|nr:endolytic transglycosylase MltG [Elusimicrobiota bacterium]
MRRALAAAAALVAAAALAWVAIPGERVAVEIPPGLSARQTAELLGRRRVVVSVTAFRLILKAAGLDRRLKPGFYSLRVHQWPFSLARKLALGETDEVKVVIPEGWRVEQVAERLAAAGVADGQEFATLAAARRLEGRLFPATYRFPPGFGAERAAARMTAEFDRQIAAAYAAAQPRPKLTLDQALILASIVEREAVRADERPKIAAVYLNRLKRRMPLQADPTVQYALGYWKKELSRADLKTPSPYNTYLHGGLPPGPICSPGLDSVLAALNPAPSDALYFVADAAGGHVFSATNEEQNRARAAYKKALRRRESAVAPPR